MDECMGDNFMKIAICDDEYSTCNFIENIILQYAKVHGISAEVDIYQTEKAFVKTSLILWICFFWISNCRMIQALKSDIFCENVQ